MLINKSKVAICLIFCILIVLSGCKNTASKKLNMDNYNDLITLVGKGYEEVAESLSFKLELEKAPGIYKANKTFEYHNFTVNTDFYFDTIDGANKLIKIGYRSNITNSSKEDIHNKITMVFDEIYSKLGNTTTYEGLHERIENLTTDNIKDGFYYDTFNVHDSKDYEVRLSLTIVSLSSESKNYNAIIQLDYLPKTVPRI